MKPILLTIPLIDLPVYGYGAMLGLSFVCGWCLTAGLAKWCGLDQSKAYMAMFLGITLSLVGARLFHVIATPEQFWTLKKILNIREGGLVAYGGYIVGVGVGALYWKLIKANMWAYLDCLAPGLALGLGLTRLGCFLRGCCYGIRSDSAFSLSFPPGSLVAEQHAARGWDLLENGYSVPVLPTQLFASSFGFMMFAVLLIYIGWAKRRRLAFEEAKKSGVAGAAKPLFHDGYVLMFFMAAYGVFRFLIEFIRNDGGRGVVGPVSTSQFISLIMVPAAVFMMAYWLPRHPFKQPESPKRAEKRRARKKKLPAKKKKKR